jgi:diphthamide biosynthesis methyltransferase
VLAGFEAVLAVSAGADSVLVTLVVVAAVAGTAAVVVSAAAVTPPVFVAAALADCAEPVALLVVPARLVAAETTELARPDAVPAAADTAPPTVLVVPDTA